MPKASLSSLPVSGIFGINKPSGPVSMSLLNEIQPLIYKSRLFVEEDKIILKPKKGKGKRRNNQPVKVGQGGTLDPLADGVLVVAVGKATKSLQSFLDGPKEYTATCLLGAETDSYDSEGKIVRKAPWKHVTEEAVKEKLCQFTGKITQIPPIFSALKMDGKPLYEYARKGLPLPRPIASREVTILSLELVKWLGTDHSFSYPTQSLTDEERKALEVAVKSVDKDAEIKNEPEESAPDEKPAAFVIKMTVSGGTYVRSIVHDLAHAVQSCGHVVTLSRTRQGQFTLAPEKEDDLPCIPYAIFDAAVKDENGQVDADGWLEWEQQVIEHLQIINV
ncbi:pseudouridine synthase [Cylindrobasidium torrendii FP15055 ss-10]|uniref:tRNA pseudouridine(55) synthase n=1 Tax=Cylindrobasidium torrendii FP15055 ss-10 TaxID=1314674 RepID=A0A0D7BP66_9AGAR|nr:pseudouridine synthase [Cylindrobasidium torrendii FP15055 ss-10]